MRIFLNILASIISFIAMISAFDPKNRYNEHCIWSPDKWERLLILSLIIFVIWRIWAK